MTLPPRLLLIVPWLCIALAACGGQRVKLVEAAGGLQARELRMVDSPKELDQLVNQAEQLDTANREAWLDAHCGETVPARNHQPGCNMFRGHAKAATLEDGDDAATLDSVEVTGSRLKASDLITNNQAAGVDEGDIVKKSGDFVLVLRNGSLHSVRIARDGMPVLELAASLKVAVDAGGEDVWYDEILTFGSRVLLLGFNYGAQEEVAELLLFELDAQGQLSRQGRYWLRTNDYFDSTNYGARIQGDNLLLSLSLPLTVHDEMDWPEWSRRDVVAPAWSPLVDEGRILYPVLLDGEPFLHVVLQCPISGLSGPRLDCRSIGIVGNEDSVFYANDRQAYLAMAGWDKQAFNLAGFSRDAWWGDMDWDVFGPYQTTAVLRIPYDDRAPDFAMIQGTVDDQFRFHEAEDGSLFIASNQRREDGGLVNLHRIRPGDFGARRSAQVPILVALPVGDGDTTLRFSERMLWLGESRPHGGKPGPSPILAQPLDGSAATSLRLPHSSDALQPMFGRMLSVGESVSGALSLSLMTDATRPRLLSSLSKPALESAESRSHALNFSTLPAGDQLLGLPVLPLTAERWDWARTADLAYVKVLGDRLVDAGSVLMQDGPVPTDCDDCWAWYGNARTFFVGSRIFALSSAVLKEAAYDGSRVVERRRLALP